MCNLYRIIVAIGESWIDTAATLIFATASFSFYGHAIAQPNLSWSSAGYQTVKMLAVDGTFTEQDVVWPLDVARWLGVAVWSFAVITILIGLFSQRAPLTLFVAIMARNHVIVCGLGDVDEDRERLVKRLRSQGRDVLVLEPNPIHPSIETCRSTGAICLMGTAEEPHDLERAKISRASAVVVLGCDDRRNVNLLGNASKLLADEPHRQIHEVEHPSANEQKNGVNFVLQVCEPGLMNIMKRHRLHTDPRDRMKLRLFSMHEMAASAGIVSQP